MVKRRRGTTLVEIMVVAVVFLGMMGIIMSFYIESQTAKHKQDQISEEYRQAAELLMRLEEMLRCARIYKVDSSEIVFASPQLKDEIPVISRRFPRFSTRCHTVFVDVPTGHVLRIKTRDAAAQEAVLYTMTHMQKVTFATAPRSVLVNVEGQDTHVSATIEQTRVPYSLAGRLLLDNPDPFQPAGPGAR